MRGSCPQGWHRLAHLGDHQALKCKIGNQRDFFMVRFKQEYAFTAGCTVSSDHSDFQASELV